jgi:hypothetical protein
MISRDMIQKIKGILLGLTLVLGISVAVASWNPPTGTPSASNNEQAPINVGSAIQSKNGTLGVTHFTGFDSSSFLGRVDFGSEALFPEVHIWSLSTQGSGVFDDDKPVCADAEGKLKICNSVVVPTELPSVTLTVDQPTISTSEVISISQSVELSWSTTNLVGGTCTSTTVPSANVSGSNGFTGTPSYAGGTDTAVIEKFGTTTFTITCTPASGSPVSDSVTVTATGLKTFVSGTPSFTPSSSEFNSGTSYTVQAVGGAGGGVTYAFDGSNYDGTNGGNGTQTTVAYNGSTILTAGPGGGASFTTSTASTVGGLVAKNGTAGAGSTGTTPLYSLGTYLSNQTCGGGGPTTVMYGAGGSSGCNYNTNKKGGAGGSQTTTSVWATGLGYTFSFGSGGTGPNNTTGGGQAQNGGNGAVRFIW